MKNKFKNNNISSKLFVKSNIELFQRLPIEIILKIFDYLTPRQLFVCSCVCKQWRNVANSSEVWRKVFQSYHINRPIKDNTSFKTEFIRRSREFTVKNVKKTIDIRRKNHLFPDFSDLKKSEVSIVSEIFGDKENLLTRNSLKLKSIISDSNHGIRFHWQRRIDDGHFPLLADIRCLSISILVPGRINNLVPIDHCPLHRIKVTTLTIKEALAAVKARDCSCKEMDGTIEWHMCVPRCLIGLWPADRSVAYFSVFLAVMDLQATLEMFLLHTDAASLHPVCAINVSEPGVLRLNLPRDSQDLKCTLVLEDVEPSKSLLFHCWRSVDLFTGRPLKLVDHLDPEGHLQMNAMPDFRPSLGHLHLRLPGILKIDVLIVAPNNDPIWSYSSAVALSGTRNRDVELLYPNTRWTFMDDTINGSITTDSDGRIFLTEFFIL